MNNSVRFCLALFLVFGIQSVAFSETDDTSTTSPTNQRKEQGEVIFVGELVDQACVLDLSKSNPNVQTISLNDDSVSLSLGIECSQGTDSVILSFESRSIQQDGTGHINVQRNPSIALSAAGYTNSTDINGKSLVFDLSDKNKDKGIISMTAQINDPSRLSARYGETTLMTISMIQQ